MKAFDKKKCCPFVVHILWESKILFGFLNQIKIWLYFILFYFILFNYPNINILRILNFLISFNSDFSLFSDQFSVILPRIIMTSHSTRFITKTYLFKYLCTENFTAKKWKFWDKKLCYFSYFCSEIIDCGYSLEQPRRDCSNKYPQSVFSSRNKKNNVYSFKPQFYYVNVGFKGVKII